MKKVIISLGVLLFFFTQAIHALTKHHDFVKEGKVWNCKYSDDINFSYTILGDTTIAGESFKKVYLKDSKKYGDETSHYYAAVQEDGFKVYLVNDGEEEKYLLYNFGVEEGLVVTHNGVEYTAYGQKLIQVGDNYFNIINLTVYIIGEEAQPSLLLPWVEGIGGSNDPFNTMRWVFLGEAKFDSCYEDGNCIFTNNDFYSSSVSDGIRSIPSDENNIPIFYDLSGRRLNGEPQHGVYIKDGRVVIN